MLKNRFYKNKEHGDYLLLIAVVILAIIGTIFIYSASNYSAHKTYGDAFYFVKKQIFGLIVGFCLMLFMSNFNYKHFVMLKWIIVMVSFMLLLLVFVPGIGKNNNGANRWITIAGISLQSSEVAKFGFVIFSAIYMAKNYKNAKTFLGILPVVLVS